MADVTTVALFLMHHIRIDGLLFGFFLCIYGAKQLSLFIKLEFVISLMFIPYP